MYVQNTIIDNIDCHSPHREDRKGCVMAYTCDPIMVLSEDIEFIDSIVEERYKGSGVDIFERSNRKALIAERKAVIHMIMLEWKMAQDNNIKNIRQNT